MALLKQWWMTQIPIDDGISKIRLVHYVIATSGETTQSRKRSALVCPPLGRRGPFKSFSYRYMFIVYKQFSSESTVNEVVRAHCPEGLVYDDPLEYCRQGVVTGIDDTLLDVFFVALWFEVNVIPIVLLKNFAKHLRSIWLESLLWSQINSQHFNFIDKIPGKNSL